jgi:hypothetical protein
MGRFKKLVVGGFAAAMLAAGSASADFLLADFDDGTNVSNIGTYFYLYSNCSPDSKGDCKKDDVHYLTDGNGKNYAGPADEYGPVSFKPAEGGAGGAGYAGVLHVDVLPAHVEEEYYPGFGLGILLTDDDDKGLKDFKNVTAVKFKAMSSTDGVTCGFKVETTKNSFNGPYSDNPSNAYFTTFKPTGTWKEYTVSITPVDKVPTEGAKISTAKAPGKAGDMAQEGWWGYSFTFNPEEATKIAWFIQANANEGLAGSPAEVWIDDVTLVGSFTYTAPDICVGCTSDAFSPPTPNKLLSDFEGKDPLLNERGYYWYFYTDSAGGGNTGVSGLVENEHTGDWVMKTSGNGREGGAGAFIEFTMGKPYQNDKNVTVQPFVGIGANVYDDDNTADFLDASNFTGVYFEFKTDGVEYIDLEITDDLDAIGKEADKDGEVYYTRIAGSAAWKSATVPFSKLVLPSWVAKSGDRRKDGAPLNKKKLAQIKFKQSGNAEKGGSIAIDNVYLYGASDWTGGGSAIKLVGSKAKVSGLRATYGRGVVGVNWIPTKSVASGTIQLVNTKGRVVASAPVTVNGGKVTANLRAGSIPTGMYFVRVNAKDVKGAKVVQQTALSIVK